MTPRLAGTSWPRTWAATWPVALAGLFAGAWPITLYLGLPWLLPAAVVAGGVGALVWARPAYGVAVTLFLLPLLQADAGDLGAGTGKPFKPLVAALILATAGLAAVRGGTALRSRQPWLPLAAIGFASAMLASAVLGTNPRAAAAGAVYLVLGLLLLFAAARLAGDPADRDLILAGAMAGLVLAGLHGVIQHFASTGGDYGFYSGGTWVVRAQGAFGHPSLFAAYLMLSIPIAAALAATRDTPRGLRLLGGAALATAAPALFFTYTRGAILGLVLGSLLWLALVRPRLAAGGFAVALVVAAIAAPSALGDRFSTYRNTQSDAALLLRTGAWTGAVEIFSQHPVLGAGMADFPRAYAAIPDDRLPAARTPLFYDQLRTDAQPWHAHNVYLTVLAEGGIIGFMAFALFAAAIVATVLRATRVRDPAAATVSVGVGCAILAWAVHGLVDFDAYWVSLPLFAFIGLATAQVAQDEPPARRASAAPARSAGTA